MVQRAGWVGEVLRLGHGLDVAVGRCSALFSQFLVRGRRPTEHQGSGVLCSVVEIAAGTDN